MNKLEGAAPQRWRARVRGSEFAQVWVTNELSQNTKTSYSFEALALMQLSAVEVRYGG